MTAEPLYAAEHFMMRNARLIDRHRYTFHFQGGPIAPIRSALEAYRNVDGGYGNALEPDLRGHGSQPRAVEVALRILDELGEIPPATAAHIATWLTSVTRDDGGVPWVLPTVVHSEAAPWWRACADFSASLTPTAAIAGLLYKHHVGHPWRDRATVFTWRRVAALRWIDPEDAVAVTTFLQHVPDRARAAAEMRRLAPMIRGVITRDPEAAGPVHKPLDLASHPDHVARELFTDAEISVHLDALAAQQGEDGGWPAPWDGWCPAATLEWRGIITLRRLLTLRAYGRLLG